MPTRHQSGMTSDCDSFYFVEPGNGCVDIANAHGISTAPFIEWSPAVGEDGSGLWANAYVCVGIIGPGGGFPTPTPIQLGMTSRCDRFHMVGAGGAGDAGETILTGR